MSVEGIRLRGLQIEEGLTRYSLENAKLINSKGYKPLVICHEYDSNYANYLTKVYYYKNENRDKLYYFLFNGFTSGYYGEGSRAFNYFLTDICNLYDKELNELMLYNLKENFRYIFTLEKSFKEFINVNISKKNIRRYCLGSNVVDTHSRLVFKSWDTVNMKMILNIKE